MFLFSLTNVTKKFKVNNTSFCAVNNVTLNLPSRGLVSIVGKSGCGKSTLLSLLSGIEKASNGTILFNNKRLSKFNKKQLSKYRLRDTSMVYQHYNLIDDLTVVENIALPLLIKRISKRKAYKRADEYLNQFHLSSLSKQNVRTLSGGEKQRVAILRALIIDPKVILCDEPTGALDEKNSLLIMDELKKISRSKLVLMVSHNLNLVKRYSDRIIEMKDGTIISDNEVSHFENNEEKQESNVRYSSSWTGLLTKKLFKNNILKSIFSFVSLTVGFISIFIGFGFINGSQKSQSNALKKNLSICYSTISETSYYSLANSPLEFKKNIRPDSWLIDEYLQDIDYVEICPNTNYFFSPYPNGYFNDEQIQNFEMIPLNDKFINTNSVYPRIAGDFIDNSLTNVVVNKEFLKEINLDENEAKNQEILISYQSSITLYTNDDEQPFIKDDFSYKLNLKICDVIDEFSFMNSPKIYYSYEALVSVLKNEYLSNISQYKGTSVSVYDYINDSNADSPESSYSSFAFLNSIDKCEEYFSLIERISGGEERIQIESNAYTISDSYKTFISSFKDALFFFLIIGALGDVFILGMISLSNFLENKKQSAILTCLGARSSSISSIYLTYNCVITTIAFISGFLFSFIAQSSLNSFIDSKFGLDHLIQIPTGNFLGLKFGFMIIVLLASLICTFLFTLLPILAYKNFSISNELRDE